MEIRHFRLIKTISDEGNIANSSEKLFLTQSALSHQLRVLEEQLGFKVFLRTRNQWRLTEEGLELYNLAKEVLSTIEKGWDKIKDVLEGSKGNIRLSMECYSFYQGISSFIQKMGVLYPEIKIDLILEATHQPISKLLSEEIDIAVVTTKPDSKDLTSLEIFEDEILTVMHRENLLNQKQYLDADDFKDQHLIIHSFPLETVAVYEKFLKLNKIMPFKTSAIPMTEVSLELAGTNQGIMCLPKWALKSFKISDEIVFKRISRYGLRRMHYLTVRNSDLGKKYVEDFIVNFKESFSSLDAKL